MARRVTKRSLNLMGRIFGRWTVVSLGRDTGPVRHWLCRCACGAGPLDVQVYSLLDGTSRSCGCLKREATQRLKRRHGEAGRTSEYNTWVQIRGRCNNKNNPAYRHYGGRGIKVCQRWERSFEAFLADVGRRPSPIHSLERIKNNRGYSPSNCKWATRDEQANNRRSNRFLTAFGKRQTLAQWSRETGVPVETMRQRIDRFGWPVERALLKNERGKWQAA